MPKLTEATIKRLKPPASGYAIHWDDEVKGFGVRITAAGSKAFIFNYRTRAGRLRRLTIGSPPTYSVEAARDEAKDYDREVSKGRDPLAHRQSERDAPTFKDLADYYIERHLPTKRPSLYRRRPTGTPSTTCSSPVLGQRMVAARSRSTTSTAFTTGSPNAERPIGLIHACAFV